MDGGRIDVTYQYEKNKPTISKDVAVYDMTDEEKSYLYMTNSPTQQMEYIKKAKLDKKL